MPYEKLTKQLTYFSKLRIKQLFDDLRIRAAWFASTNRGKRIFSKKKNKFLTLDEIVDEFARIRAILIALGYPLKPSLKKKSTALTSELYKRAIPLIIKYLKSYKNKVKRV